MLDKISYALCRILLLLMTTVPFVSKSQTILTKEVNSYRGNDTLIVHKDIYFSHGEAGRNATWNINKQVSLARVDTIFFLADTAEVVTMYTPQRTFLFDIGDEQISLVNEEGRLSTIQYTTPKMQIPFPLQYGDHHTSPFSATGIYYKTYPYNASGSVDITVDAEGTLTIDDDRVYTNALRVYTLTTSSFSLALDTASLDTACVKQEIIERYDWYVRGFRYPVCGTELRTSYDNLQPLASTSNSYFILPDIQKLLPDYVNEELLASDSNGDDIPDIIHYEISIDSNNIVVSYDLDSPANLSFILCDAMGIVHQHESMTMPQGEAYTYTFDHSALHHGAYVIYINVNGKIYNEIFRKI